MPRRSLQASQAALENAQAAVQASQAAVENAKIQLAYCSIRSPMDGRTGSLLVQQGNLVKANDTQSSCHQPDQPIYVTFSVPEQNLRKSRSTWLGEAEGGSFHRPGGKRT